MGPPCFGGSESYCKGRRGERLSFDILTSVPGRLVAGFTLGAIIAVVAHRHRALSRSGALAAVVTAAACTAAGWTWAFLLIAFFLTGTGLSRFRESVKRARTNSVVEKGGERDAAQVLANGGVFAAAAIASIIDPSDAWQVIGSAAIAASAADTWASEIGTLSAHDPRSIITGRPVAPGTSGGVTAAGLAASVAGAGFIALVTFLSGWGLPAVCAAIAGGIAGSLFDSILGATVQTKRWCASCEIATERAIHICGTATTGIGGKDWLDNDAVNALSSMLGALIGALCLL